MGMKEVVELEPMFSVGFDCLQLASARLTIELVLVRVVQGVQTLASYGHVVRLAWKRQL